MITISSLAGIWSTVWPILAAILFFGFLIMSHEAGHFAFAKLFHVKVNEFSIGMGPVLLKKQGPETQYSLRLLPIGGYVAMEGEDKDSDDAHAFNAKPAWQKGIIILAGAVVNILTGVIIMAVILSSSDLIGTPVISDKTSEDSVVFESGMQAGDTIYAINGHRIYDSFDLSYFMSNDKDGVIDFIVERDGELIALKHVKFNTTEIDGTSSIDYDFIIVGVEPTAGSVTKYAFLDSFSIARLVISSLKDLVVGNFSIDDMSGPIGTVSIIADTTSSAVTEHDATTLLTILALIAINIGVFNLLPFPALDGGRFVFIVIEGIIRRPVPDKVQNAFNSIGLALLFGLMIVVTFNDIAKLF